MRVGRGKRAFMWVATLGFSLIGLLLLVVGPDLQARLVGSSCLLLFGLGGAWYLRFTREQPVPDPVVVVDRTDLLGISEAALELPLVPRASAMAVFAVMLLLGLILSGIGVVSGEAAALFWGGLLTVLALYLTVAQMRSRGTRQRVVLTQSGVGFEHPVSSMAVRWADIEGIGLYVHNDVVNIGIEAQPQAVVQRTGSRMLAKLSRGLSGAALSIPMPGLQADPDRLLEALNAYASDPPPLRDPHREVEALRRRLRTVVARRTAR